MRRLQVAAMVVAVCSAGCKTTPDNFYANRAAEDETSLCRAYLKTNNFTFQRDLATKLLQRGIDPAACKGMVRSQDAALALGILAVGVTTVAAASAANSGASNSWGGSGTAYADWDEFYNEYGQLTWRCREIWTGQFTEDQHCRYLPLLDDRWPSKRVFG